MDENDLLSTNQFIKSPELSSEVPSQFNDEFKNYYRKEVEKSEQEKLRQSLDRISIRSLQLDEENDGNSIINTNRFTTTESNKSVDIKRGTKEIKTYVSVDSRDRQRAIFEKPNFFKIFLGKTFYNVKTIRLSSIEFPNTNAVINSNNNKIYWRNQEDIDENIIDDVTGTYPVYEVELRIGSYLATTLQTEIANTLAKVKRQKQTGDFHYFVVNLDIDTDIVTLTSLILQQLEVNPFSVVANSNLVTINMPNHGFGEIGTKVDIYILGTKNLASIQSSTLNGSHTATVISDSSLQYEVNVKATETAVGGGNTIKLGQNSPFQLLFGENKNTIAPNIGYPLENSSVRINNYIKDIQNLYQTQIITTTPVDFENTFDYIGKICSINGSNTTPNIDGNRVITKVINSTTFYIQTSSEIVGTIVDSGQITFGGNTYDILSISPVNINTVSVETFSHHNFDNSHIGTTVVLSDTISVPSFDGENIISSVLNENIFIINGSILGTNIGSLNYPVTELGTGGVFPQNHILETTTKKITNVIPGTFTRIVIPSHGLAVGQSIQIYNLITTPSLLSRNAGVYKVHSILDSDTFTIDFETIAFDPTTLITENAYIGLNTIIVSFPYHNFNKITSITQPSVNFNIVSIINYDRSGDLVFDSYKVTTTTPHYLEAGFVVTLSGTNSTPILNNTFTVLEKISSTEFIIPQFANQLLSSNGSSGTVTPKIVEIVTYLNHGLSNGDKVTINNTNATIQAGAESLNSGGYVVSVISDDTFRIPYSYTLLTPGTSGIIGLTQEFYLYGTKPIGGIPDHALYNLKHIVKDIIDDHTFTFECNTFASSSELLDQQNVYINSLFHGFSGSQDNTKNNLLNRSINLEGENYVFLSCPQLATMMNTGNVKNIFARITLDQSPGSMVFSYLSNPKEFLDVPLDKLDELEFSIVNYDGSLYEFNDLDYSFVLEITEVIDTTDAFNFSSRRCMTYN